jgi:prepilin-type N-terminal cleavage/methylation domain-containing protein
MPSIEKNNPKRGTNGFTLIELLVVIAIIAILAVVVVLTLNPAEMLRQSRDANRVSDMATLNDAISFYITDQSTNASFSLGNVSSTYISIPDSAATSTAGDQCNAQGLGALPSGDVYHCPASSTFRNVNTTGWIPINFSAITSGSPFGNLPVDPVNQTSSGLYYTYNTNGTQYQMTTGIESQKYIPLAAASQGSNPAFYTVGTNLSFAPYARGLTDWWPLSEGTGSTTIDASGFGNNGTWYGTAAGTGGTYYAAGHNQGYAGYFNQSNDYVQIAAQSFNDMTVCAWFDTTETGAGTYHFQYTELVSSEVGGLANDWGFGIDSNGDLGFGDGGGADMQVSSNNAVNTGAWTFGCATRVESTGVITLYVNGVANGSGAGNAGNTLTGNTRILFGYSDDGPLIPYGGYLEGVRIYNQALSATEIATLYAAGK